MAVVGTMALGGDLSVASLGVWMIRERPATSSVAMTGLEPAAP
jgi:tartrate dehydratase alpha subunit/fumarate hydratase class I-like protein